MKTHIIPYALALAVIAGPAAADITFRPGPDMLVGYQNGQMQMWTETPTTETALLPLHLTIEDRAQPQMLLGVRNKTDAPLTITADQITIVDDRGRTVDMLTQGELETQAENQARGRRYWNRFVAGMANYAAGQSTTTGTFEGRDTYRPMNSVSGTFTATTTNPAQAAAERQAIAARHNEAMDSVEMRRRADRDAAADHGFRPHTVPPGENYFTGITLAALDRRARSLTVRVQFGGETHQYVLLLER